MKRVCGWLAVSLAWTVGPVSAAILPGLNELRRHDDNGNGDLEAAELGELRDEQRLAVLKAYDRDDDGAISAAELAKGPIKEGEAKSSKDKKKPEAKKKKPNKRRRKANQQAPAKQPPPSRSWNPPSPSPK